MSMMIRHGGGHPFIPTFDVTQMTTGDRGTRGKSLGRIVVAITKQRFQTNGTRGRFFHSRAHSVNSYLTIARWLVLDQSSCYVIYV